MESTSQKSQSASRWMAIGSFILTFVVANLADGFLTGGGDHSAEGAYIRIALAAVGFGVLLVLSRRSDHARNRELLLGAAWGLAIYGLGQVAYTPIYTAMRQVSSNLRATTEH